MKRLLAFLTALTAVLATAPAAMAMTIVVNDNGDAPDALAGDNTCDEGTGLCTLRAAIQTANDSGGSDTIQFGAGGQAPNPLIALPAATDPVEIDGGGTVTVTFGPAAIGVLLDLASPNNLVKAITFTGGAGDYVLRLSGTGNRLDTVTVRDAHGTAIRVLGGSGRVDGSTITNTTGTGIEVNGSNATIGSPVISSVSGPGIDVLGDGTSITTPDISGAGGEGILFRGNGGSVSDGRVHGNTTNGVTITGQQNVVARVVFYANGARAIATAPGANGGITPPAGLRIGPRRADGTLPLTGTAGSSQIELWSGDPSGNGAPGLHNTFHVVGDFAYNFPAEPAPGTVFGVLQTGDGIGTSEFQTVKVPDDVRSPEVVAARALDTSSVRVDFSEPMDPGSLQKEDFKLSMAGSDRAIDAVGISSDGRAAILTSSGWRAGEAGAVDFTGVGAVADAAGNVMLSAPRLRVGAAPGDFIAPLGGSLKITPSTICLTRGTRCRRPGMVIKFTTTESGKARMLIKRSNKTVGSRLYANIVPGTNTLKFNGRLGARKLRAGRYRLLIYVQDAVGNITDQPPIQLFSVRRVTK